VAAEITRGCHLRCHPRAVRQRAFPTISHAAFVTSPMSEGTVGQTDRRAFSRNSEKATAEEGTVRIEDSHLPRHPANHSLLFLESRKRKREKKRERDSSLSAYPFSIAPQHLVAPSRLNLPGHLHPRYLASRPRWRLLIRRFTESKTLNAQPVEIRQRSDQHYSIIERRLRTAPIVDLSAR